MRTWMLLAMAVMMLGACDEIVEQAPPPAGVVGYYHLDWQVTSDTCGDQQIGLPEQLLIDADCHGTDFIAAEYDCGPFSGGSSDAVMGDNETDVYAPDQTDLLDCSRTRSARLEPVHFVFDDASHQRFTADVAVDRATCGTKYKLIGTL